MKINSAVIITLPIVIIGYITEQMNLWIPVSVFIASLIDVFTRDWYASDRLGTNQSLSVILKFLFTLIGFYSMIGQFISIGLIAFWFIF